MTRSRNVEGEMSAEGSRLSVVRPAAMHRSVQNPDFRTYTREYPTS